MDRTNNSLDQDDDNTDLSNPYYKLEGEDFKLNQHRVVQNDQRDGMVQDDNEEDEIMVEMGQLEADLGLCDPLDLNVDVEEDDDENDREVDIDDLEDAMNVEVEVESDEDEIS